MEGLCVKMGKVCGCATGPAVCTGIIGFDGNGAGQVAGSALFPPAEEYPPFEWLWGLRPLLGGPEWCRDAWGEGVVETGELESLGGSGIGGGTGGVGGEDVGVGAGLVVGGGALLGL